MSAKTDFAAYQLRKQQDNETKKKNAYDRWYKWWETRCDWSVEPMPDESWNGCVSTIVQYVDNFDFGVDDDISDEIRERLKKNLKKFKCR